MILTREKVAVVTGASTGMGRELAVRLRKEGCSLALCDINIQELEMTRELLEAIPSQAQVTLHTVDVSNRADVARFAREVQSAHGPAVHLLFNNAGIVRPIAFDRMDAATFDKIMAVNLDGVVTCTREFWPLLLAAAPDRAALVNTSSVAGFLPNAASHCTPYAVSKYAVRGFSEHLMTLAPVIAPHLTVHCVHPGAIHTELITENLNISAKDVDMRFIRHISPQSKIDEFERMSQEEKFEAQQGYVQGLFRRFGYTAKEAADMIVDGVLANNSRIMVGWDAVIMDWWVRAFPRIFTSKAGQLAILLTSVIGRHFYGPLLLAAAVGVGAWKLRGRL